MNQTLQKILTNFIKEQGKTVVKKERTFKSFMADLLKDYPAERSISEQLSQLGILSKLASPATKKLGEGEIANYADRLEKKFGVDKAKAMEVIKMWAVTLGVHVPSQSSQPEPEDVEIQKVDTEEDDFFEKIKRENTIEGYSEYIDKYPDGKHLYEAVKRMYKIYDELRDLEVMQIFYAIAFQVIVFFIAAYYGVNISTGIVVGFGFIIPLVLSIVSDIPITILFKSPTVEEIELPIDNNYQEYSIYKNMIVAKIDKKNGYMKCIPVSEIIKKRKEMVNYYHKGGQIATSIWFLIAKICILLMLDYISFIK